MGSVIYLGLAAAVLTFAFAFAAVPSRLRRPYIGMCPQDKPTPGRHRPRSEWRYQSILCLTTVGTLAVLRLLVGGGTSYLAPLLALLQGSSAAFAWATGPNRLFGAPQEVRANTEANIPTTPVAVLATMRTVVAFCEAPVWLFCGASVYVSALQESSTRGLFNLAPSHEGGVVGGLLLLTIVFGILRKSEWRGVRVERPPCSTPVAATGWRVGLWTLGCLMVAASLALTEYGRVYWRGSARPQLLGGFLEIAAIGLICAGIHGWVRSGFRADASGWLPGWLCLSDAPETVPLRMDYLCGAGTVPVRRGTELLWGVLQILALILATTISMRSATHS